MKNLIIGNTSQFSHYMNDSDNIFLSSREKNIKEYKKQNWNKVFLCFGESRKFIDDQTQYEKINYSLSKHYINSFKDNSEYIYVFSTCELWNKHSGQISLELPKDHWDTSYLNSKRKLSDFILLEQTKNKLNNVKIIYPFNFNSPFRNKNFLFGKIYNSILNKEKISIGNTYFYRDMISPSYFVKEILNTYEHKIIGSGRMIFVNDFIRDLYKSFNLEYENFVTEESNKFNEYSINKEYYLKTNRCLQNYSELLSDTTIDLKNFSNSKKERKL